MTTIQNVNQNYNTGNYGAQSVNSNATSLVQSLEQVFTQLAAAISNSSATGGVGGIEPGTNSSVVNALAQALEQVLAQYTGQSTNVDALLGSSGNTSAGAGGGSVGSASTYTGATSSPAYTGTTSSPAYTSSASVGGATSTNGFVATSGNAGVSAVSGNGGLTEDGLYQMIHTALSQNSDPSQNGLSGPQNLQYWDPSTASGKQNLDSFYNGIVTAHNQFFPNTPMSSFARAVVAEAGAESTLNPTAGGGGLLQVTPQDAVADYNNHGTAIKDASGNTVLSPGAAWNPNDPGANVMMWAWYNKNSVAEGGVAPNNWGKGQNNGVTNTYGNILANWLGGPGNKLGSGTDYYVNRIQGFYEKMGGTGTDFQSLLNQQLTSGTVSTK